MTAASNKGMKQTKPAQAMELRSLSPVLGRPLEVTVIRRTCGVLALVGLAPVVYAWAAQPIEELVYVGTPQVKYSGAVGEVTKENLSPEAAIEYTVRIVRRGSRYYWASRGGRELHMSKGGVYVTFSCEAGFVKVINPAFDALR